MLLQREEKTRGMRRLPYRKLKLDTKMTKKSVVQTNPIVMQRRSVRISQKVKKKLQMQIKGKFFKQFTLFSWHIVK